MIIRHLTTEHIGKTVTLPTLAALGRCRSGTLHSITLETTTDTSTLRIGDHLHSVPNDATVYVTTEVSGL